jgi:hypothetical protein
VFKTPLEEARSHESAASAGLFGAAKVSYSNTFNFGVNEDPVGVCARALMFYHLHL